MGMKREFFRHSKRITSTRRWQGLRLQAIRRDGWKCVQCQAKGRLEVDHIQPVRSHPELAFEISNLQSLCAQCHSRKTRLEIGLDVENPKREAWKKLLQDMQRNPQATEKTNA